MGKKYLSLEEAARLLGMDPKQLSKMREKGEVRAFADRGTWKFRQDEIEELSRMQMPDSDPEVPMGDYSDTGALSNDVILGNDEEALGDQPTIIRRTPLIDEPDSEARLIINEKFMPNYNSSGALPRPDLPEALGDGGSGLKLDAPKKKPEGGSDSDVRLVFDDSIMGGSSDEIPISAGEMTSDSVSDVRLHTDDGSDSDVSLPGSMDRSDSDVQLITPKKPGGAGSDSDVQLITPKRNAPGGRSVDGTESDVTLALPAGDDADVFSLDMVPEDDGSFVLGGKDSGIFATGPSDSGIALDVDIKGMRDGGSGSMGMDSGITLGSSDSGTSLDAMMGHDSGISLDSESAFSLADSGISLAEDNYSLGAADSGISLEQAPPAKTGGTAKLQMPDKKSGSTAKAKQPGKSSKPADDDDELAGTIPMMPALGGDDSFDDTQMEVPMLGGDDSEFEFSSNALDDESTNVIMLDDEGGVDDYGATMVGKGRKGAAAVESDDEVFDVSESSESGTFAADDDDLEVADDIIGEDDELEEDVFGADEGDFDDDLQSGQSHADFVAPVGGRMAAPVEVEWGPMMVAGLAVSSLIMLASSLVMYDLVRTIWQDSDPTAPTGAMLGMFRGFFGA